MEIRSQERGVEVVTDRYRLLLERLGGFAVREVEVFGAGRLDRFDRAGEGPHPTCMYFDNCTVNYAFQMGYYGKSNRRVEAVVDGASITVEGELLPIVGEAAGRVLVRKKMIFEEDAYSVDLSLTFDGTGPIEYLSVWWDVNDKWLCALRSSAGLFMPLRVGVGDSFGANLSKTWRPLAEMNRGAGSWMEMVGEQVSLMTVLRDASPETFEAGGMKYWDGPDDADAGEGVSHGCINFDFVNCELSRVSPLDLSSFQAAYQVFLSGPTVLRGD